MKKRLAVSLLMIAFAVVCVRPLAAHHSVAAEFSENKAMAITGVLTKVEWVNPHVWFYLDVKDSDGKVESWAVETLPPNAMSRAGFPTEQLVLKSTYSVEIWPSLKEAHKANGRVLTMPDGHKVDIADKGMWVRSN